MVKNGAVTAKLNEFDEQTIARNIRRTTPLYDLLIQALSTILIEPLLSRSW